MYHEEIEAGDSKEHEQRVRTPILREADVIGHEGQRKGTWQGNGGGE